MGDGGGLLLDPAVRAPILTALAHATAAVFVLALLLAALALWLRLANERTARRWARLEEAWTERLLEVLGEERPPQWLWERVPGRERLPFVQFVMRYSARVRGVELERLKDLVAPYLDGVAARLAGGSAPARARAVHTLCVLGRPDRVPLILRALEDRSPLVRMMAVRGLSRPEHAEHFPGLLAKIDRVGNVDGEFVVSTLAAGGTAMVPWLRRVVAERKTGPAGRAIALETLRQLHDAGAADLAAEGLRGEEDPRVAEAAVRLLGELGRAEHLPLLRDRCDHASGPVRARALEALGRIGDAGDHDRIRRGLADADPWVALRSAQALAAVGRFDLLREHADAGAPGAPFARELLQEARA